jgi:orotidine 5'-phosphate decarboxylase subfamily 2
MQSFNSRLRERSRALDSHLCIGLDITPERLGIAATELEVLVDHARKVVDATIDLAVAYKLNLAFFERWGSAGYQWLETLREYIGKETIVIGDAKRGDIGSTAEQYASSLFGHFQFDAVTVNPYLGYDAVQPFAQDPTRGVFVLCRTSNPSAVDFQLHRREGLAVYESVAVNVVRWNRHDNLGLVVGATVPEAIARVRSLAPDVPLLVPGIGAQGGDLVSSFSAGNRDGVVVISVSRAVCFAGDGSAKAIRQAALELVETMRAIDHDR